MVNLDGSGQRWLADGFAITAQGRSGIGPSPAYRSRHAWSPDGQLLVVSDLQESVRKLFTIDGDGDNLSELADCLCQFDWQPIFK